MLHLVHTVIIVIYTCQQKLGVCGANLLLPDRLLLSIATIIVEVQTLHTRAMQMWMSEGQALGR